MVVKKKEETYDAGVFERVKAEVAKLLKEPQSLVEPPQDRQYCPRDHRRELEQGFQQRCSWSHQQYCWHRQYEVT